MLQISEIVKKTEEMFDLFNEHFYDDELTRPAITVSPDGGRGAYGLEGHFADLRISVIIRIFHCFLFPERISCHILNRFHLTAGDSKEDSAIFFRIPAKENS